MRDKEALRLAKWIENLTKEYGIGALGVIATFTYAFEKYQNKDQAKNYVEMTYIPNQLGYKV